MTNCVFSKTVCSRGLNVYMNYEFNRFGHVGAAGKTSSPGNGGDKQPGCQ